MIISFNDRKYLNIWIGWSAALQLNILVYFGKSLSLKGFFQHLDSREINLLVLLAHSRLQKHLIVDPFLEKHTQCLSEVTHFEKGHHIISWHPSLLLYLRQDGIVVNNLYSKCFDEVVCENGLESLEKIFGGVRLLIWGGCWFWD